MLTGRRVLSTMAGLVLVADGKYALKASDTVGKETDDDLFIGATKTVKVGTVASPSAITKTLRIPSQECVPANDTQKWSFTFSVVAPNAVNTNCQLQGSVVLPAGVTITAFRARLFRNTTNDTATAQLARIASDTSSSLGVLTHAGTGCQTLSASLSELVAPGQTYAVDINLKGVAFAVDAKLGWIEVDYTMPSYDKGY